ncbi:MAG: bifunctional 2-polyprenyl-6-hydroxyphenol methylase/3-demethylubiquinol 3-O-methyltransferase UbiG [Proteobacteria bacterium]|nr:bifunctional 2-polyprenyl-6-hydroxyphenol methylase/3-demethylubiquinol 3-O-methyltransferase UbiG [Pseudomonadota bacterium]
MAPVKKTRLGGNPKAPSVDPKEIENFSALAETWWDPAGPFRPLHKMNPTRLAFIRGQIENHFGLGKNSIVPFKGLKVLDIGCGGGLLCEPMTRLGAAVTGIDASEKNIQIAALHAKQSKLTITYRAIAGEDLAKTAARFDVILNMEVLEHVADIASFLKSCRTLLKKDGCMLFSTINRTPKAYALAILGAEYILGWLPRGTHSYQKFIKPSELDRYLRQAGFEIAELKGFIYDPVSASWKVGRSCAVNYAGLAVPE